MNKKLSQSLSLGALVLVLAGAARAAEPSLASLTNQTVGEWTDSGRLEFSGLKTFTAQQVRSALLRDVTFLLASHPQALRAQFLPTLESRLTEGFLSEGFPEARVRATLDEAARRVPVTVTEGPRYFSGDVKVNGAITVPVTNLVRRLTERWIPSSLPAEADQASAGTYLNSAGEKVEAKEPRWIPGDPASFDAASLEYITRRLTNALAEFGCFFPTVQARVVIRPGTDRADLHIDLDEGRRGRLGRVEVLGLKSNATDVVLKWLDLAPGQSMANDLIGRLERQLWSSGRFLTYRLDPAPVPGRPDVVNLDLWLEEFPAAPALGREFSRLDQVALKLRNWMLQAPTLGDDLIVSKTWNETIGEMVLVLSGQGMTVVNRQGGSLRYAATIGSNGCSVLSFPRQRRLKLRADRNSMLVYFSMLPQEAADSGNRFNIQLGAGVSTRRPEPNSSALQWSLALAPVAFIHLAHPTNQTITLEGDALVLKGRELTLKIDATSGRLLELVWQDDDDPNPVRVRVERGAFARLGRELDAASAAFPDALGTNQPWSTRLAAVGAEVFHLALWSIDVPKSVTLAERARAATVLEKVYAQSFAALDPLLEARFPGTNEFSIPDPPRRPGSSATFGGWAELAAGAFELANQLLPARSWPWTLARETAFTLGNQGQHTEAELKGIYTSTNNGPLAFLSTAVLLNLVGSSSAQDFAARGLERLAPAEFLKDCQLLLDPRTPLGRMFHDTARAVRDLPEADLEALAAVLSKRQGVFLRLVANRLKAANAQPLADTLQPLLEEFWQSDLRSVVEASLRRISGRSAATAELKRLYEEGTKATELKLYNDAIRSFRQAAELGLPAAQHVLAQFLDKGLGGPKDADAAMQWYSLAASNGLTESQVLLGSRYSLGLEGPNDVVDAYYWYSRAAQSGDRAAEALRNSARRKLTPAQLQEVERRLENVGSDKTK